MATPTRYNLTINSGNALTLTMYGPAGPAGPIGPTGPEGEPYQSATAPDPAEHPSWFNTGNGVHYLWHGTPPDGVWVNVSHEEDAMGLDPADISGLVAGFRVGDTVRTGAAVNTWTDITGNGHDASFTSTKATVTSTDTGEYAIGGAIYACASPIPANFADMTILCVFGAGRAPTYNACGMNQTLALTNPVVNGVGGGIIFTSGTAQFYNAVRQGGCLRNPNGINAVTLRWGASACSCRSNGITDEVAANGSSTLNEFEHIWNWEAANLPWGGEMVELYFFDRALTDSEIDAIEFRLGIETPTSALHVIGDSFVGGTGASTAATAYCRLLEAETGLSLVAHGGPSTKLATFIKAHLLKTIESSVNAGLNPIVVFDIGKNDVAAGTTAAALQVTYEDYCTGIKAAGAQLVCVSLPPRGGGFVGTDAATYETERLAFNTWLRGETTMWDALADVALNANLGDVADLTGSYYDPDLIHLTDLGYVEWKDVILAAINTL